MAAPKFSVSDVIYLITSAKRGFLESYRIDQIRTNDTKYKYGIRIRPHKFKEDFATIGDRVDLRKTGFLEFREEELCSLCEALIFSKEYHERVLTEINNKLTKFNCIIDDDTGTGTGSG